MGLRPNIPRQHRPILKGGGFTRLLAVTWLLVSRNKGQSYFILNTLGDRRVRDRFGINHRLTVGRLRPQSRP